MPPTTTSVSDRPYKKVERQRQPNGEDGVRFSLKKVCLMIAEGRIHPDVRAWTMKQLAAAGNPKGPKARAEALLNAVRKQSGWVPDPTDSEFMAGAHLTLGDGTKPPFFALGDCDDLTIALGSSILSAMMYLSAAESVGAKAAVVGHAYGKNRMIEHVLGAIWDPATAKWYYVDPSLQDMPFGECKEFTRERVYLVPSAELFCDDRVCLRPGGKAAGPPPVPRRGDFVAVNGTSDLDAPESTSPAGWGALGDVPAPTLCDEYDITGINEIAVTHKPPPCAERIINQGMAQMWMDAAPCSDPLRWFAINPPIQGDPAAEELIEPWSDGSRSDASSWAIPNSGFMCTPSSR